MKKIFFTLCLALLAVTFVSGSTSAKQFANDNNFAMSEKKAEKHKKKGKKKAKKPRSKAKKAKNKAAKEKRKAEQQRANEQP